MPFGRRLLSWAHGYRKRKHTVEPVFGIIKSAMGFRQFMLRGLEKVRGEWDLVCLAYNVKRLWSLQTARWPSGELSVRVEWTRSRVIARGLSCSASYGPLVPRTGRNRGGARTPKTDDCLSQSPTDC